MTPDERTQFIDELKEALDDWLTRCRKLFLERHDEMAEHFEAMAERMQAFVDRIESRLPPADAA